MLIDGLAAILLALCVGSGVTWMSRLFPPNWELSFHFRPMDNPRESLSISSGYNFVYIEHCWWDHQKVWDVNFRAHIAFSIRTQPVDIPCVAGGFAMPMHGTMRRYEIGFGYFPIVFAILPMVHWLPGIARRTRAFFHPPQGTCRRCGYDLRATPDRCPECGTIPRKAVASTDCA
jgi:hypothetical protein